MKGVAAPTLFQLSLCSLLILSITGESIVPPSRQNTIIFLDKANGTKANNSEITPFIVGGVEATKGDFPWLVNLRISIDSGRISFCGGALIEMDVVLTAAHCLVDYQASQIKVYAGDHNWRLANEEGEQVGQVNFIYMHEEYNGFNYRNDIAILKLASNFTTSRFVSKINLPSNSNDFTGSGTVAGWGTQYYSDNADLSDVLRKVTVPIVPNSDSSCKYLLRKPDGQFCAGTAGKDSCQGDSGGPFMCSSLPGVVCGVVSYGNGCGDIGSPGVYTKVGAYLPWIAKKVEESGKRPTPKPGSAPQLQFFAFTYIGALICSLYFY